jgi:parvulin-like peptidyl-prolyl isomerase
LKLSKKTNAIILWIVSITLVLGMIIMFTPTIGNPFATGTGRDGGRTVLLVNNERISELHIARERQQTPLYNLVVEGEAARDLELLLLDNLIDREVLRQASARTRVSSAEVRQAVNDFREANSVAGRANEQRYLTLIGRAGFTDQSFRQYIEAQLRQERYLESVIGNVEVTDEEVRAFYELHPERYQSEARIRARQIVVEDEALAQALRERVQSGESFAALAEAYSLERADRAGALGAPEGEREPRPVGRTALPTAVANAAFALQGPGVTEVVASGGRYYLIAVEEYLPSGPRPFEEVEAQVRADALEAKRNGEVERVLRELREQATIVVTEDSPYRYDDEVVARVGDRAIRRSELVRATYLNPQIQQFLSPDTASLVTDFFRPLILEELIERELAYQGAQRLELPLVGSRDLLAQAALNYASRDAVASEEDVRAHYEANLARFTVPARAEVIRAEFGALEAAAAFREALLAAEAVDEEQILATAAEVGGEAETLGNVTPGQLEPELDNLLFATNAFEPLSGEAGKAISDVLAVRDEVTEEVPAEEAETEEADANEAGDEPLDEADVAEEGDEAELATRERYVVLVAARTPERVRPLEEVRAQVESEVLAAKRAELRQAWLERLREEIPVENLLAQAPELPDLDDVDVDEEALEGLAPTDELEPTTEDEGNEEAE